MTTPAVTHIFATLATGRLANDSHPFVVYAVWEDGTETQHTNVRDLRDALLFGNGMAAAFMAARVKLINHNVVFDPRFGR